jgi:dienelactone hydrolase
MNRLQAALAISLLLAFRANAGDSVEKNRLRDLPLSDWSPNNVMRGIQDVMGKFPGTDSSLSTADRYASLDLRTVEETDCGSFVRRLISYQSEPDNRVPAFLLIPKTAMAKGAKPVPAVLCLHPTNQELGAKVIVGLGGAPNRTYALELTQRGFVTLAPCYPTMGGYAPELEKLGYQSGTMKAIFDNVRGLDLLDGLPFVIHGRYGAIGHSLGGHNAIFTAVFDPRITVVVSSCGFDSFLDYYSGDPKMWEPGKGWTQRRYMPRLADYAGRLNEIPFDFHELIALLAPRVVFVNAPLGDTNFQWRSVDRIIAAAKPLYQKHGAENNLQVFHPDCGHDFPDAIREQSYQLLEKHLR